MTIHSSTGHNDTTEAMALTRDVVAAVPASTADAAGYEGRLAEPCPYCGRFDTVPAHTSPDLLALQEPVADVVLNRDGVRVAFRTLTLLMEVLDGRRASAQVVDLAAPRVLRYLRAVPAGGRSLRGGVRMLTFHPSQPDEGSIEVAALVRVRGRRRAMAASFELSGPNLWVCSTIRIL